MKISHIAIYTANFERLSNFYEEYFYAIKDADYTNPETGLQTRFLKFDNDVKLEIMTRPDLKENKNEKDAFHTGFAHFCISVGSKKKVDSVSARLFRTGFHVVKAPRITGDGYYESCIEDPDGNLVEITE